MNSLFQILTLAWSIEGGVMPNVNATDQFERVGNYGPILYGEYGFELTYPIFTGAKSDNGIYASTWIRNEFLRSKGELYMTPVQDTYGIAFGIRWNEVDIGYTHICTHSVETMTNGILSQRLFGAIDKFSITLSGKI